ncbi:MAG TPA: DUF1800 domain-containing protein [Gemmataceae bacterium]|nr:DUF1800 domain-containing protein [Gemmataceae bacterium]
MKAPPHPPLEQLDPTHAWEPWQPGPGDPWNLRWAGHLYRRAGFGPSLAELREAVRRGPAWTLDHLLHAQPGAAEREQTLTALGDEVAKQNDVSSLRGWWVYLILNSLYPLREKLTLFWHNHFATSIAKVGRTELMFRQNQVLRHDALGNFRPLLLDISRDPAMLIWLDSNSNLKGKANENYARELMELFSLGIGHYTEHDVREAARAFTGWHTDGERFDFDEAFHDDGEKTILGKTGKWDGGDVLRIILAQPEAAQFLVRKLYRHFISETAPPSQLLRPLAEQFRRSDYDIAALIGTMLRSRHFFSAYAYRQRVKSPVEFVVGTARALVKIDQAELPPTVLAAQIGAMGEPLFEPPTVKGWSGGRSWLNSATILARDNFAALAASGNYPAEAESSNGAILAAPTAQGNSKPQPDHEPPGNRDPAVLIEAEKARTPEQIADVVVELLLQGDISTKARARLVAFLEEGKPHGKQRSRRIREALHAVMTMPEYQLA